MADETGAIVPAEEVELQDPAETAGDESGEQAAPKEGESVEEHKKRLSGAQRNKLRIERLEKELESWRDTALGFAKTRTEPAEKKETAPVVDKRPTKQDFIVDAEAGTYDADKYEDALLTWNRKEAKKELLEEIDRREQTKTKQGEQEKIEQTWRERETAVKAEFDDYEDLVRVSMSFLQKHGQSPTAQAIGAAITESELGPQLLRHLGEESAELERIGKMTPLAAVRELGKMEARLAKEPELAEEDEPETPTLPPVKAAPKPPTPVRKVAPVRAPSIHDPKIPFSEFAKMRDAGKTS
jgi:hypothetical protein